VIVLYGLDLTGPLLCLAVIALLLLIAPPRNGSGM
jgi:hypothetical protein